MSIAMVLLCALALEWSFGDPKSAWHPVAWFGRWASWWESQLYGSSRQVGMMVWFVVVLPPLLLVFIGHLIFGWVWDVLLLWFAIGWTSLFEHVRAVLGAVGVEDARAAVSCIVSRDTRAMSEEDARNAALESLAENASDAVLAPLFWFVLLGPVGAVVYRMVNTLDAMWGYRSERYQCFGWWSAKVDDVANYIPARITARLILWAGKPGTKGRSWSSIKAQAMTHDSPNAGWPEVALAYAARIRLGGPVCRDGVQYERPFYGTEDAAVADEISAWAALDVVQHALMLASLLAFGIVLVF